MVGSVRLQLPVSSSITFGRESRQRHSCDLLSGGTSLTETEMLSFWWNFNHWLHRKLSFWQLSVQPVMKISSKWRHLCFSATAVLARCPCIRQQIIKAHLHYIHISVWASESKVRHNQYKWIDVSCLHWSEPVSDIFVSDIPCPSSSLHVVISLDPDFRVRPQLCNAHAQSRLFTWSCTLRCCCQNSLPTMINLLN